MFWTIPVFLAVWSVVGTDLYFQGHLDATEQPTRVAEEGESVETQQPINLTEALEDE